MDVVAGVLLGVVTSVVLLLGLSWLGELLGGVMLGGAELLILLVIAVAVGWRTSRRRRAALLDGQRADMEPRG